MDAKEIVDWLTQRIEDKKFRGFLREAANYYTEKIVVQYYDKEQGDKICGPLLYPILFLVAYNDKVLRRKLAEAKTKEKFFRVLAEILMGKTSWRISVKLVKADKDIQEIFEEDFVKLLEVYIIFVKYVAKSDTSSKDLLLFLLLHLLV